MLLWVLIWHNCVLYGKLVCVCVCCVCVCILLVPARVCVVLLVLCVRVHTGACLQETVCCVRVLCVMRVHTGACLQEKERSRALTSRNVPRTSHFYLTLTRDTARLIYLPKIPKADETFASETFYITGG